MKKVDKAFQIYYTYLVGFMSSMDIRKLNAQKQYTGEMEFSYPAPDTLIEIPFVKFGGAVQVRFSYELYEDNSLEIFGKVRYRLEGQCSRCLELTSQELEGELNAYFQEGKDVEDYGYTGGIVQLDTAIEDAILASMPFSLLCKEECKGIAWTEKTEEETKKE